MSRRYMITVVPDLDVVNQIARETGQFPTATTQMAYEVGERPDIGFFDQVLTITGPTVDLNLKGVKSFSVFEI